METQSGKTSSSDRQKAEMQAKPQTERKHPEEYEEDLSPDRMAGQNIGSSANDREKGLPTAYDVKDVHRRLSEDFRDDELRKIPVLREGQRLQQGATYLDVSEPEPHEFTATGDMEAGPDARLVPKDEVPYSLWNRLLGVDIPERIAERGERPG